MQKNCLLEYKQLRDIYDGYYSFEINLKMQATDQQFTSNAKGLILKEASQVSAGNLVRQLYKANLIEREGDVKLVTLSIDPFNENISHIKPKVIKVDIEDKQLALSSSDVVK